MTTPGGGMTKAEALMIVRAKWGSRAYAHVEGGWCRVGVIEPQGPLGFGNDLDERGRGRDYARAIAQAERFEAAAARAKGVE